MDEPHLVQLVRKVQELREAEPLLKALYQELFDQDRTDEAKAVLVALARVRAALLAGEQRLDETGSPSMWRPSKSEPGDRCL